MKKIIWKEEFSVGVEVLDQQHQQIIKIINSLADKPRFFLRFQDVSSALTELNAYVSEHFLLEERLLKENGYQDLLSHSDKHIAYSERITELCRASLHRRSEVPQELLDFLTDWWRNHILQEDMQYKAFFEEKGVR